MAKKLFQDDVGDNAKDIVSQQNGRLGKSGIDFAKGDETGGEWQKGSSIKDDIQNQVGDKKADLSNIASKKFDEKSDQLIDKMVGGGADDEDASAAHQKFNQQLKDAKKLYMASKGMGDAKESTDAASRQVKEVGKQALRAVGRRTAIDTGKSMIGLGYLQKTAQGLHNMSNGFFNTQFGQFVDSAYMAGKALVGKVSNAVGNGVNAVENGAKAAGAAVGKTVGEVGDAVGGVVGGTAHAATSAASGVGTAVGHGFSSLAGAVGGFVSKSATAVVSGVNAVVNAGAGLFGMSGVASGSIVPTVALASTLLVGGATGGYALSTQSSLTGGCIILPTAKTGTSTLSDTTADTSADQQKNAQHIADVLKKEGASGAGIAGYLGNAEHESGVSPKSIQGGHTYDEKTAYNASVGGYAFGLNQWDSGRRVNLLNFAKSQHKNWDNLDLQLSFALDHDGSDSNVLRKYLGSHDSVDDVAEGLRANWERGGAGTTAVRQAAARKWYKTLNLSSVHGDSSIIGGASDSGDSNEASASKAASKNASLCDTNNSGDTESGDATDGTGSMKARNNQAWKPDALPADAKKYAKDPKSAGMSWHSSKGWLWFGGQCTNFADSYFYALWHKDSKMPKGGMLMGNGNQVTKNWANAMGGKPSSTPKAGAIASIPAFTGIATSQYGHTFVVSHVFQNGDILAVEQNTPDSGDTIGQPGTWNYRYVTKDSYTKDHFTFFAPKTGKPDWNHS